MRTCLFEDHEVALLEPISTTRPVFDILCGQTSLRTKQQWYCGSHEVGVLIRPALEELFQVQNPHTPHNSLDWIREGPVLFLNGRFLPPDRPLTMINEPHLGMVGYQLAYAWVPPHEYQNLTISTLDEHLRTWKENYPLLQVAGKVIRHLWEIVDENGPQMELDFRLRTINRASEIPPGVAVIGPHDSVLIDPT
ncbi:MAG: putative sugar nucleotidyl transferase, partial [Bdellovibrionales bacterium]